MVRLLGMLRSIILTEYLLDYSMGKGRSLVKFIDLNLKKISQVLCSYIMLPIYKQFEYT